MVSLEMREDEERETKRWTRLTSNFAFSFFNLINPSANILTSLPSSPTNPEPEFNKSSFDTSPPTSSTKNPAFIARPTSNFNHLSLLLELSISASFAFNSLINSAPAIPLNDPCRP